MIGRLKDLFRGRDGEWIASFSTPEDIRQMFDDLAEKEVSIEIKRARKQRSRNANNFAWELIDKIAEKTNVRKSEVYRSAIREIGGVSEIVCVQDKAVNRLRDGWEKNGLGWQTDTLPSKIQGCTNVVLYYGSSTYDTEQMSRLISLLIQDAENLGIPTLRDEGMKLAQKWNSNGKAVEE